MEVVITLIGVIILIEILILYGGFSWGYVLFKFWTWFLIPVFPNLIHITYYQAIGIMLVISLFKNKYLEGIKNEYKDIKKNFIIGLITPWLTLIFAYFIYIFIH